jgi:hypothetical protein
MKNGIEVLLSPPLAFLFFLCVSFAIYIFAGAVAAKGKFVPGKFKTYIGGEDISGFKIQFGYRSFFFIAIFFTMMHVAVLVIATIGGRFIYLGILYLAMIFLSVLALIAREKI